MAKCSSSVILCAALLTCLFVVTDSQTTQAPPSLCLACSYTFGGDGTRDLECVTDATNFVSSSHIPCSFATHRCVTIAVYSTNYQQLNSLTRTCLASDSNQTSCDGGLIPRCRRFCNTSLCNIQHGDIHASLSGSVDDGGSGVASLRPPPSWPICLLLLLGGMLLLWWV